MMQKFFPRIQATGLLVLLTGLMLTATGCNDIKMPWDQSKPKAEEQATEEAEEAADAGGEETEPLDMKKLLPPAMRDLPAEEVTIPMPDHLRLFGQLYDPSMTLDENGDTVVPAAEAEEYQGTRYPLVILVHGLNHTNGAWQDLPATLVKAGYAVFAVDVRGHGKSTRQGKRRVSWRMMQTDDWQATPRDMNQIIKFFAKGEDYPEIDGHQVAIVGERLGANIATQAARKDSATVKALVLLSPFISIKGIDASRGLIDYPGSTLILTSEDEKEAYTNARHLYNWVTGPKTLQIYRKVGQGTDMLVAQPSIGDQIRDWLSSAFPSGSPPPSQPEQKADAGSDTENTKDTAHHKSEPKPESPPAAANPVPVSHTPEKPAPH